MKARGWAGFVAWVTFFGVAASLGCSASSGGGAPADGAAPSDGGADADADVPYCLGPDAAPEPGVCEPADAGGRCALDCGSRLASDLALTAHGTDATCVGLTSLPAAACAVTQIGACAGSLTCALYDGVGSCNVAGSAGFFAVGQRITGQLAIGVIGSDDKYHACTWDFSGTLRD